MADNPVARTAPWITRVVGVLLSLAVVVVHVIDQGGLPGSKDPGYVGIGYYALEIAGIVAAGLLLSRLARTGWFLAIGVAVGPLVGYLLSRGPGLPDYDDDRGNWTEPLGLLSLVVEGILLILSVTAFLRSSHVRTPAVAQSVQRATRVEP